MWCSGLSSERGLGSGLLVLPREVFYRSQPSPAADKVVSLRSERNLKKVMTWNKPDYNGPV